MGGSRNFHERGSNENGNFWSQTRGGPTPQKSRNYLFLGKIFKFQGGGCPPLDPRMNATSCFTSLSKLFSDLKNWNQIFTHVNLDV